MKRHWSVLSREWIDLICALRRSFWLLYGEQTGDCEVISIEAGRLVWSLLQSYGWNVMVAWTRVLRMKMWEIVRSGRDLGGSTNRACWYVGCEKWWKQWHLVGFSTWETETYRALVIQYCHPCASLHALLRSPGDPWKMLTLRIYLSITKTIALVLSNKYLWNEWKT